MLGVTSERFPKGGAFLLGLMGTAGNLSIQFVLPWMGSIYDEFTNTGGGGGTAAGSGPRECRAGVLSLCRRPRRSSLIVVFGLIWLRDRATGGYRVETLGLRTRRTAG